MKNSFPILDQSVRLLLGVSACFVATSALAGSPRLTHTYPAGAQRGSEIEVTCSGTNLDDARGFLFDEPGFEGQVVSAVKGSFKAKIKVPADARLGEHSFRAITASGVTDVRLFYVTPFPMVEEIDKKKLQDGIQPVAVGTTVYGHTPEDDRDSYQVELKKGQHLSVEVIGMRLHTQTIYDPFVSIAKADGKELVAVDDSSFTQQDPVASIVAPEDGKYTITIRDSTNAGLGPCHYLMNIGDFAQPVAVYPAGGPAGQELKVQLIGDAGGTIERTITLPDREDDSYKLYLTNNVPTPEPNQMRISHFPNVLEVEPNNDPAHATPTNLDAPFAANGIIQEKDDVDFFKFHATKDQPLDLTVYARRLRSPLDSVVDVFNDKGVRIAGNDDSGGPDSYLRWKAPADGDYTLSVRDQLGRGGANFTYRVEVTPVQPKLTAWLPEMTLNQNQDRRAIAVPKGNRYASLVRIKRTDVVGEVKLEPTDLPPGVTASMSTVEKSVDTIPMVFEAAPDAAPAAKAFNLTATPTENAPGVKVISEIESSIDIAENGNKRPFYTLHEKTLPIAITDEIPVKINLVSPKAPLLQNGSLNLKVVAERKDDFKGPINLILLYAPPGVGSAGIQQIKEGTNEGTITISANANAALQKWKVCVVGNADFGKGPVWFSTQLQEIEVAAPLIAGQISRTFVDQGDSTTVKVKLDQKVPFEGKAKLQLLGLPPNTTADEKEITKDDTEVQFTVKADKTTPAGQHKALFCQFSLEKDGDTMISNFAQGGILRVDKGSIAQNDEPKK